MAFTVVHKSGKRTYKSDKNTYEVMESGVLHITMDNKDGTQTAHHYLAPGAWVELADDNLEGGSSAATMTDV
ncbi:hypothetical protein H7J06_22150 [Mycobacterium hodleri]|uniref:hypothetical protein n=1 Tax=Mycolicibacterium hodleri TaxID=49897 RepID=UPI000B2D3E32|nr:hypothetical protein [Mycolicibacterium hodleri]MCV7135681.1 hypothetical protein [Mycolicibacterium hodleri]